MNTSTLSTKIYYDEKLKCSLCKKTFNNEEPTDLTVTKTGTFRLVHRGCRK